MATNTQQQSIYVRIPGSKNSFGRGVFVHKDVGQVLTEFSRSGDYHKIHMVKLLQGLTAGHDHQDNILQAAAPALQKPRQFYVRLPGCVAQVIYHPNGNYYVQNVASAQEHSRLEKSTGLYMATKRGSNWSTVIREAVASSANGSTRVAITDSCGHSNIAVNSGAKALSDSEFVEKASFKTFYLHHTLGEQSITGYVRRKNITQPLSIKEIRESSRALADTMLQARAESQKMSHYPDERRPIAWVSSGGGSAVLTQALNILKQKGISFHGHNHHVFFHEIASDADQAIKLALDLGFKMPAKPFTKRLWSLTSLAVGGGHKAINYRVKAEDDYTRSMAGLDHAANFVVPSMGILGAGCLLTGSAVAGIALISAARKAYAGVRLADSIASDVAGKQYDALKRKAGFLK